MFHRMLFVPRYSFLEAMPALDRVSMAAHGGYVAQQGAVRVSETTSSNMQLHTVLPYFLQSTTHFTLSFM